jgi:hypothetical protein
MSHRDYSFAQSHFFAFSPSSTSHVIRTLLAFVLRPRVLVVSKVSRWPTFIPSGSIPEALRPLMCKNVSGPPPSPLMNPKPRSAFHVFNIPAGILFSLRLRPIDPHLPKLFRALGKPAPTLGAFLRMSGGIGDLVDRLSRPNRRVFSLPKSTAPARGAN